MSTLQNSIAIQILQTKVTLTESLVERISKLDEYQSYSLIQALFGNYNVLLTTGSPGSGKTTLLLLVKELCLLLGYAVLAVAPYGTAAQQIGGVTLGTAFNKANHYLPRLETGEYITYQLGTDNRKRIGKEEIDHLKRLVGVSSTVKIIMDEFSSFTSEELVAFKDLVATSLQGCNVSYLVYGQPLQTLAYDVSNSTNNINYASAPWCEAKFQVSETETISLPSFLANTSTWVVKYTLLQGMHRTNSDVAYTNCLRMIEQGKKVKLTPEWEALYSRFTSVKPENLNATYITTKTKVLEYNRKAIANVNATKVYYGWLQYQGHEGYITNVGIGQVTLNHSTTIKVPNVLSKYLLDTNQQYKQELAVGLPYMSWVNHTNGDFSIQNGTKGTITELKENSILVDDIEWYYIQALDVPKDNKTKQPICTYKALPGHLAVAMTSRKVLGATITGEVVYNLPNHSESGTTYVCCSRVTKASDLTVYIPNATTQQELIDRFNYCLSFNTSAVAFWGHIQANLANDTFVTEPINPQPITLSTPIKQMENYITVNLEDLGDLANYTVQEYFVQTSEVVIAKLVNTESSFTYAFGDLTSIDTSKYSIDFYCGATIPSVYLPTHLEPKAPAPTPTPTNFKLVKVEDNSKVLVLHQGNYYNVDFTINSEIVGVAEPAYTTNTVTFSIVDSSIIVLSVKYLSDLVDYPLLQETDPNCKNVALGLLNGKIKLVKIEETIKETIPVVIEKIGIIGTAGRGKTDPLTKETWEAMYGHALTLVKPTDYLVSGGAAWADHIAVKLFLEGKVSNLSLHLPTMYKDGCFTPGYNTAGGTSNYYHNKFSEIVGFNSLVEIGIAIAKGAKVTYEKSNSLKSLFDRNKKIAEEATQLIAYTFTPAPNGGTKDTCDHFLKVSSSNNGRLNHINIFSILPSSLYTTQEETLSKPSKVLGDNKLALIKAELEEYKAQLALEKDKSIELANQLAKANEIINTHKNRITILESNEVKLVKDLESARKTISTWQSKCTKAEHEVAHLQSEITKAQPTISSKESELLDLIQDKTEELIVEAYNFNYLGKTISTEFELSNDQKVVLETLIDFANDKSKSSITLQGAAGTGKTSIIGYLQKYLNEQFLYCAPTHAATVELAFGTMKTGNKILPITVASMLKEDKKTNTYTLSSKANSKIKLGRIIVIDETSMISALDYSHLLHLTTQGYKLIFLGDKKQIPEVKVNASVKNVTPAFTAEYVCNLDTIHRTSNEDIKNILQCIRNSSTFNLYKVEENTENVKFYTKDAEFKSKLAEVVISDPQNTDYIAYTNAAVSHMNKLIREDVFNRTGLILVGDIVMGYLGYSSKQIEKGNLANSISYLVEEVERTTEGYQLTLTSDRLTYLISKGFKIPSKSRTLLLPLSNNEVFQNDFDQDTYTKNNAMLSKHFSNLYSALISKSWNKYYSISAEISEMLSSIDLMESYIYNYKTNQMELYTPSSHQELLRVYGSNKSKFIVEKGVDFGHAITIHKAQGRTTKNVFFDANTISQNHDIPVYDNGIQISTERQCLGYVGMSRASKNLFVNQGWVPFTTIPNSLTYTVAKAPLEPIVEVKPSIEYVSHYTRKDAKANPHKLFVFGDNFAGKGFSGQAKEMRGEPNAVGIPTKRLPDTTPQAYLNDGDYDRFKQEVDQAVHILEAHLDAGGIVVFPSAGIGTNLADLQNKSPLCWNYLCKKLKSIGIINKV
jgi:DNA replication protein DnaC